MPHDRYKTFGRRFDRIAFAARMGATGISPGGLSARLKMGKAITVRQWLDGVAKPSPYRLMQCVRELGCPLDEIAPRVAPEPHSPPPPPVVRDAAADRRRSRYFQRGRA